MKTDIAIAIPYGFYGRVGIAVIFIIVIAPRSGLAWKSFIDIGAGVIDSDYRGNVGVVTFNHGDKDFQVNKGDRIAQLIIEQISLASATQVESFEESNKNEKLEVKLLSSDAKLPTRGSIEAAGFDLFSSKEIIVQPHSSSVIPTDIIVHPPIGTYCRIAPRSGMAWKNFTDISAGVITNDGDTINPLNIYLHNHNNNELKIEKGDRVAQLILESYEKVNVIKTDKLDETNRGSNGFGSTGVSLNNNNNNSPSTSTSSPHIDKKRKISDSSITSDLYYTKDEISHDPLLKNDVIKLYSKESQILPPLSKNIVKTGIFTSIPDGTYGRLSCTPELAEKFVDGGAGVIDSDYRGEIGVILFNHSPNEVVVNGEVCNMTIEKISLCSVKEVEELTETDRGAGGFGSTGK